MSNENINHKLCDVKTIAITIDVHCGTVNIQTHTNLKDGYFTPHEIHAIVTMLRKGNHNICTQSKAPNKTL